MWKAILFDLDGTLLPMDMERFTEGYFTLLARKAAPAGYESQKLIKTIWQGTKAMVDNDGAMSNEARFWQSFAAVYGPDSLADRRLFDDFYAGEFRGAVTYTQPQPSLARQAVAAARRCAGQVILATNPIFPRSGVETRLEWIGLRAADFDHLTSYENSSFCKPNPRYYQEILAARGLEPGEALMVGNDMDEDIRAAAAAGLNCYLVQDCLIDRGGTAVDCPRGPLAGLPAWLDAAEGRGVRT